MDISISLYNESIGGSPSVKVSKLGSEFVTSLFELNWITLVFG